MLDPQFAPNTAQSQTTTQFVEDDFEKLLQKEFKPKTL